MNTINISMKLATLLTLAMILLATQGVMAATVYQWTDEEGVVHFSDIAPNDDTTVKVDKIQFVDFTENNAETDKFSIINQLDRMTERRKQVTEERMSKKRLQLEAERLAKENDAYESYDKSGDQEYHPEIYYYPSPGYFTGYGRGYGYGYSIPRHRFNPGKGHSGGSKQKTIFKSKIDQF